MTAAVPSFFFLLFSGTKLPFPLFPPSGTTSFLVSSLRMLLFFPSEVARPLQVPRPSRAPRAVLFWVPGFSRPSSWTSRPLLSFARLLFFSPPGFSPMFPPRSTSNPCLFPRVKGASLSFLFLMPSLPPQPVRAAFSLTSLFEELPLGDGIRRESLHPFSVSQEARKSVLGRGG